MQKSLFVNNCWRKQNQEKWPTWFYIYFGSTFRINFPAKYLSSRKKKFVDHLQSAKLENETFSNPYYLYFPIASTIAYIVVSIFDWVLLGSSVIGFFLGYSEIGFFLGYSVIGSSIKALSERVLFRVLFRVFSDWVFFIVLLRVLSVSILSRVLSRPFLVFGVPSVASTTWGVLQWFSILNISVATDVLILSLGNLMQLPEIWASFWNKQKGFILHFWLGSEYPYPESFIFRSIHLDGIPKDSFQNF